MTHHRDHSPDHLVLMGVAGSGKTTLAGVLAERLGWTVAEADEFHPAANVAKMAAGTPLDDDDREPWLASIRTWMDDRHAAGDTTVLTCSALRRRYRDALRQAGGRVVFVHLSGSRDLVAERMAGRTGHFMPPALLPSQFSTLEPLADDEDGATLDIGATPDDLATAVLDRFALTPTPSRSTR
ncbi:gluconokinase [Kineococcus gynurae]|uniref:Gluconokinase n=1 Tax=Kineococcus gynurae TaxID=452979 RepID=A0ABV5LRU7_9ACTN